MQVVLFLLVMITTATLLLKSKTFFYYIKLKKSELFDVVYYRKKHSLSMIGNLCPIIHYVLIGESKGFKPREGFCPKMYVDTYTDLSEFESRPFLHYLLFGRKERRSVLPVEYPTRHLDFYTNHRIEKKNDYAIVLHIYYHDLWKEIYQRLSYLDIQFDLFITLCEQGEKTSILYQIIKQAFPKAIIFRVDNHGRDILPFIQLINHDVLIHYKAICKIHTKKSLHLRDGDSWRKQLIHSLLPQHMTGTLLAQFLANKEIILCAPDKSILAGREYWGNNLEKGELLSAKLNLAVELDNLIFPAGSMYWIKPPLLRLIKKLNLNQSSFEEESSQLDGTTAHIFERLIGYLVSASQFQMAEVSDILSTNIINKPLIIKA